MPDSFFCFVLFRGQADLVPSLDINPELESGGHEAVLVGEVRLSNFKQVLARAGIRVCPPCPSLLLMSVGQPLGGCGQGLRMV